MREGAQMIKERFKNRDLNTLRASKANVYLSISGTVREKVAAAADLLLARSLARLSPSRSRSNLLYHTHAERVPSSSDLAVAAEA